MKKIVSALTATTLLFAVSCTGASSTGSTTGAAPSSAAAAATTPASGTSGGTSAGATGGATTGETTSGGSASAAKACSLLSTLDAQKVVGNVTMAPTTQTGTLPGTPSQGGLCVFDGTDGKLTIGLLEHTSSSDFSSFTKSVPGVQQLQGIGDQAYLAKGAPGGSAAGASVLVLKGGSYLSLSATSSSKSADDLATALQDLAKQLAGDL